MSLGSIDWDRSRSGPLHGPPRFQFNCDTPLLVTLLLVIGLGFIVLYSALGADAGKLMRQGVRFAAAFGAFFVLAQIPPHY